MPLKTKVSAARAERNAAPEPPLTGVIGTGEVASASTKPPRKARAGRKPNPEVADRKAIETRQKEIVAEVKSRKAAHAADIATLEAQYDALAKQLTKHLFS
jgi:hypothetical protein